MSSSTNAACVGAHRSSPWGQLNLLLDECWQRSRSRNELESLDDAMLRDIGLSHRESRIRRVKAVLGEFNDQGSVFQYARSKGGSW